MNWKANSVSLKQHHNPALPYIIQVARYSTPQNWQV